MLKDNLTDTLLSYWLYTIQSFGVEEITATQVFNQLVTAYSSPNRYYHNLQHIHHVLNTIQILQGYAQNLLAVQLAAWFHDIVYNPETNDNEEKSADYAEEIFRSLNIPVNTVNTVTRLILLSKNHQVAGDDLDGQVFIDADLAILAIQPDKYQEYAQAIRQEYAWMSEENYVIGRKKVLEQFLVRPQIYFTPLMLEFAEIPARVNLRNELLID